MAKESHITFAFHIDNRPNRYGRYSIYVRVTQHKKHKHIKTSVEVANKSWFSRNAKFENWIKTRDPEAAKKNETLAKELDEVKQAYSDIIEAKEVVTPHRVKAKVEEGPVATSFMEFVREHNESLHANGQIRYWKQFRDLYNKLELFRKKRRMPDILFVDLTVRFLDKFEQFLQQIPNQKDSDKKLNRNTILNNMKRFRTLTRKAVKHGYLSVDKDPFLNYEFHWLPTTKDKLESDEIDRIIKLDLEEGSMLWHARNCFLFSYYCAGIRVGDLIQLRWRNVEGGRVAYQMGKNHKMRDNILVPQARAILDSYDHEEKQRDDYIFPLLTNNKPYAKYVTQNEKDTMSVELKTTLFNDISAKTALLNKYLKQIAEIAGIDKHMSFHVSRHSFARLAKEKRTDSGVVQGLLAHSSLKTTEGYMGQFDTSVEDAALTRIFDDDQETKLDALIESLTPEQKAALVAKLLGK